MENQKQNELPLDSEELIRQVKLKYNIPPEYAAYEMSRWAWYGTFNQKEGVNVICSSFDIHKDGLGYQDDAQQGSFEGDYFVVLNIRFIQTEREEDTERTFLFTNDLPKFFKEFFEGKKIEKPELQVDDGAYVIRRSMFGYFFHPINLSTAHKPILNNGLFDRMEYEITQFVKREDVYRKLGLDYKRGILLYGCPGNGKTSFIKYLISNWMSKAICIMADVRDCDQLEFLEEFFTMKKYQDKLKIVVLEDIDGMPVNSRSEVLNFLDGVKKLNKVLFIATTNCPEKIDLALKNRPSRFDAILKVGLPNLESRKEFIRQYFLEMPEPQVVELAESCRGFAGAYFKELYVLSQLNSISPVDAVRELKRRFSLFQLNKSSSAMTTERIDKAIWDGDEEEDMEGQ